MRWFLYIVQLVFSIMLFVSTYVVVLWQADDFKKLATDTLINKLLFVAKNHPSTMILMLLSFLYVVLSLLIIYRNRKQKSVVLLKGRKGHIYLGFALSIITFSLVSVFTADPYVNSTKGNPGLPFIFPAILIFVYFLISLGLYSHKLILKSYKVNLMCLFGSIFLLITSIFGEIHFVKNRLIQLGGGPSVSNSLIFGSWINPYTYTLYFNLYTFLFGVCITLLITVICAFFTSKRTNIEA